MIFFVGRNLQNTYIKERYVYLIDVLLYFALDRGCTMIDDGWSNEIILREKTNCGIKIRSNRNDLKY